MKAINYKLILMGIVLLFLSFNSYTQENTLANKFSVHSFSISPTGISSVGELAVSADVSFNYRKNIFSLSAGVGSGLELFGFNDSFSQINILYGREFGLSRRIYADVGIGAGYFYFFSERRQENIENETIGFPISTKFRVMLSSRYSMGLQLMININSAQTIGIFGIVLQWNLKRKW